LSAWPTLCSRLLALLSLGSCSIVKQLIAVANFILVLVDILVECLRFAFNLGKQFLPVPNQPARHVTPCIHYVGCTKQMCVQIRIGDKTTARGLFN